MTIQPFSLSWSYSKTGAAPVVDEAGLSALSPKGPEFVRQLKASLKSQSLYSRGAMLTSLSLLAACGGGGGGTGGGTPPPPPPPANNAPQVPANTSPAITEDTTTALNLTAPTDADGDTLEITVTGVPTNGDILNGTVVVSVNDMLTVAEFEGLQFRPNADATGDGGTFDFSVSDGTDTTNGSVGGNFTITGVNDDPVIVVNNAPAITEDTTTALNLTAPTDVDGDTLTITVTAIPTNGDILNGTEVVALNDTLTVTEFENLQFRPNENATGAGGTFEYSVTDGTVTVTGAVTGAFTITAVADDPVLAGPTAVNVPEDSAGVSLGIVTPNEVDGDTLNDATADTIPAANEGEVRLNGVAVTQGQSIAIADLDDLEFVPAADFDGSTSFTYTVTDDAGGSSSRTITLTIQGSNDAPDADEDKSVTTGVGEETDLNISAPTDPDTGDTPTITVTGVPTEGEIQLADDTVVAINDELTAAELEGLKFVSGPGDSTGGAGDFVYEVEDAGGLTDTQTVTLSITSSSFSLDGGLNGQNGFEITGLTGNIGETVSGGGDFNNDGNADVVVSNSQGTNVFVVFGGNIETGVYDLQLQTAEASQTFSGFVSSGLGSTLDLSGDINGDGFNDLIIGAPLADSTGNTDDGEVFIVFGRAGGGTGSTIVLAGADAPNGTDGIRFFGGADGNLAGSGVAFIGDINDDGREDLAIGQAGADSDQGQVSIIQGVDTAFADDDADPNNALSTSTPDDTLTGARPDSETGEEIAGLGDVNGDGIDDFIVGVPDSFAFAGQTFGEAFIVFGGDGIDLTADLSTYGTGASAGFRIKGEDGTTDLIGASVAGGGDFNNDGINDILIGAPGATTSAAGSGGVLLIFGQADGTWDFGSTFDLGTDTLDAADGVSVAGIGAGDAFGAEVAAIGDFNGDGIDDFAATATGADGGDGSVAIIFGRDAFSAGLDLSTSDPDSHIIITGGATDLGQSISAAGDVNNDGLDDIIIGAEDTAFVLYGFSTDDGAQTPLSTEIITLDDGIALPDSAAADDDALPMDTAVPGAGENGQGSAATDITPVSASDILASDDIDLSGIA